MNIKKLKSELQTSNNYFEVSNGLVTDTFNTDEDSYYYYLTDTLINDTTRSATLTPVQISGGIIQTLDKVDGTVTEPTLNHIKYLIKLNGVNIGDELEQLLKENGIEYSSDSYLKYIETAKLYHKLREKLMLKVLKMGNNTIMYQGKEQFLPTTKSHFSLGYNEDAYIKSSIAYEIEMYLRSIFSKYGLADKDIKTIFLNHNIKDAFLKLPRDVRTKIYLEYKKALKIKIDKLTKRYIDEISRNDRDIENKKLQEQIRDQNISILYEAYQILKKEKNISPETEELLKNVEIVLNNNNNFNEIEKIIYFDQKLSQKNINDNKENFVQYENLYTEKFKEDKKIIYDYKIYEDLNERYDKLISYLKIITQENIRIINEINKLEKEINKQDNIFKNRKSYSITVDEYNELKNQLNKYNRKLLKIESCRKIICERIRIIEEKMTSFIFKDELSMETAYQDNRYTYEKESNNNYDNMLLFLGVIKQFATGRDISIKLDYDDIYMMIYNQQKRSKLKPVIKATKAEIRDFEQILGRKNEKFTCEKKQTRKGIIRKFFSSKKEPRLDAIYSAELKYLGALLIKDTNDNLYTAELAIASELYLKSLLTSSEVTHSLSDLYLKIDEKTKSVIVKKVNSILGMDLSEIEFLNILSKQNISFAFSEYRYLYEKEVNEEDKDFLSAFTKALHMIVASKIKYKSPYYDEIEKINNEKSNEQKKND